jgi:hypothetical protein
MLFRYDFSPRLSIQLQRHLEKTAALLERKERVNNFMHFKEQGFTAAQCQ